MPKNKKIELNLQKNNDSIEIYQLEINKICNLYYTKLFVFQQIRKK